MRKEGFERNNHELKRRTSGIVFQALEPSHTPTEADIRIKDRGDKRISEKEARQQLKKGTQGL